MKWAAVAATVALLVWWRCCVCGVFRSSVVFRQRSLKPTISCDQTICSFVLEIYLTLEAKWMNWTLY